MGMGKSISYFGLVAMGIGCMLGTSWLLLTGTWLETAGGPLNLAVAFALCIVIELPFAFAYMEAIPMLPLPGGEVVYSYAAFGSRGGFAVGWAGILMNTIVFCWVDLAAISLLDPAQCDHPAGAGRGDPVYPAPGRQCMRFAGQDRHSGAAEHVSGGPCDLFCPF